MNQNSPTKQMASAELDDVLGDGSESLGGTERLVARFSLRFADDENTVHVPVVVSSIENNETRLRVDMDDVPTTVALHVFKQCQRKRPLEVCTVEIEDVEFEFYPSKKLDFSMYAIFEGKCSLSIVKDQSDTY